MSQPFAIFRVEKLTTRGGIASAFSHIVRTRPTPNADAKRTADNITFIGDRDRSILEQLDEKLEALQIKTAKNSVPAVEVLITASPEFFASGKKGERWDKQKLADWFEVQKRFIAENFPHAIYAELQLDETTPHISVIDVPAMPSTKDPNQLTLACKRKYGGSDRVSGLRAWQDKAGEAVAHLGLARGIAGSKATHEKQAKYYARANAKIEPIPPAQPLPEPLPPRAGVEIIPLTKANQARQEQEAEHDKATKQARQHNARRAKKALRIVEAVQAKAVHADIATKQAKEAKATAQALSAELKKAEANAMRALPLAEVLRRLYGGTLQSNSRAGHKSQKWETESGEVVITERDGAELWLIQATGKGGKGAIDLVINASGVDFKTALKMLVDEFGSEKTAREEAKRVYTETLAKAKAIEAEPMPRPTHDQTKEADVIRYLNQVRKIPQKLLRHLIGKGWLMADHLANAVFPRFRGGAFKRGTRGKFHGTIGTKTNGAYVLGGSGKNCVFTESPIDALTLKAIDPQATVVALGGNLLNAHDVKHHAEGKQPVLAFDTDKQGRAFTKSFLQVFPNAQTLTPPAGAKDWNQALQKGLTQVHASIADPAPPATPRVAPGPAVGWKPPKL